MFFFIPFLYTLGISFFDYSGGLYEPCFAGLKNYLFLFNSSEFFEVFKNSFLFLIYVVPALTVLPLIPAIILNSGIRGANLYKILLYMPVIVSMVAVAVAFKQLYAWDGVLNYLLNIIGISPKQWLTSTDYALFSVALVTIYKGIGYYTMIYLAGLAGLSKELEEAAVIDGANTLQKHLNVTIPGLMPYIAFVATVSSISAMKVFTEIYVLTKGGPLKSSQTVVYYIYEQAFEKLDLSLASAAAVVLLVVTVVLSLLNIFVFEKKRYEP